LCLLLSIPPPKTVWLGAAGRSYGRLHPSAQW
jgi:hypothetical protein